MNRIRIFLEGCGDYKEAKAALRQGMLLFLDSTRQFAREKGIHFEIVVCGGRQRAYGAFKHALKAEASTSLLLLLVDAESSVESTPRRHLATREKWALDTVDDGSIHLMTQVMETWIVADSNALRSYYKQGFIVNRLPSSDDLEKVDKARIMDLLKGATKQTQKQEYHKTRHAPDLLRLLDEGTVRRRCRSCDRLFTVLETRIEQA